MIKLLIACLNFESNTNLDRNNAEVQKAPSVTDEKVICQQDLNLYQQFFHSSIFLRTVVLTKQQQNVGIKVAKAVAKVR